MEAVPAAVDRLLEVRLKVGWFKGKQQFEGRWQHYKIVAEPGSRIIPKHNEVWLVRPVGAIQHILFCRAIRLIVRSDGVHVAVEATRTSVKSHGRVSIFKDDRPIVDWERILSLEAEADGIRLTFEDGQTFHAPDKHFIWEKDAAGYFTGKGFYQGGRIEIMFWE